MKTIYVILAGVLSSTATLACPSFQGTFQDTDTNYKYVITQTDCKSISVIEPAGYTMTVSIDGQEVHNLSAEWSGDTLVAKYYSAPGVLSGLVHTDYLNAQGDLVDVATYPGSTTYTYILKRIQ